MKRYFIVVLLLLFNFMEAYTEGEKSPEENRIEVLKIINSHEKELDSVKSEISKKFPNSFVVLLPLGYLDGHDLENLATVELGKSVFPNFHVCNINISNYKDELTEKSAKKEKQIKILEEVVDYCFKNIDFPKNTKDIHIALVHGLNSHPWHANNTKKLSEDLLYKIDLDSDLTNVIGFLRPKDYALFLDSMQKKIKTMFVDNVSVSFSTPACGIGSPELSFRGNAKDFNNKRKESFASLVSDYIRNQKDIKPKFVFYTSEGSKNYTQHPVDIKRKMDEMEKEENFGKLVPNLMYISLFGILKHVYIVDDFNRDEYGFVSKKVLDRISTRELKIWPNKKDYPNVSEPFVLDVSVSRTGNENIKPKEFCFESSVEEKEKSPNKEELLGLNAIKVEKNQVG